MTAKYRNGRVPVPIADRLWAKVDRGGPEECWEWQGGADSRGYGKVWDMEAGRTIHVHRVAWRLENGPIPAGLDVCHHCDNPPCCNPAHLFLGTRKDNMRDAANKGRIVLPDVVGENHPGAKLTDAQVAEIRARAARGESNVALAAEYGIGHPHLWSIVARRSRV